MKFKLSRGDGETWREAVARIAGKQGLEHECLEHFDGEVAGGTDEVVAARDALYEWDCLEIDNG